MSNDIIDTTTEKRTAVLGDSKKVNWMRAVRLRGIEDDSKIKRCHKSGESIWKLQIGVRVSQYKRKTHTKKTGKH